MKLLQLHVFLRARDFEKCKKLYYQKATYKIDDSYIRINQIGYENWLKEQKEKASKGFDNIHFLG